MSPVRKTVFASLLVGAVLISNGAAMARSEDAPPAATVSYGDLDLRTSSGAAELHRRMDRAVRRMSNDDILAPGSLFTDPGFEQARSRASRQADALIMAARHRTCDCG